jgi:signal transduction histidine kinase
MGVRLRLTAAATGTFALALSLGAVLLVRSVEQTVIRAAEASRHVGVVGGGSAAGAGAIARGQPQDTPPAGAFGLRFSNGKPVQSGSSAPAPAQPMISDMVIVSLADAGSAKIFVGGPVGELRRSADILARVLWFAVPSLLVVIAATAWLVIGRALSPVDAMTQKAQRIGAINLHERLPEPAARDAIGELARMLNRMLDRLDDAARNQRQFTSNASHELRSPLASIRTQLEVALARGESAAWPAVARGVLIEGRRLEELVTDLLLLARLDESSEPPRDEIDLDHILLEEIRRARRLPIEATSMEPARVTGYGAQLASVVRNLLDNAARHARSRVEVGLRCDEAAGVAQLWVDDDGPGISLSDRERVFERFMRLEEGRSRDAGGVGVGLALVKRIVERHGGAVTITEAPLGGARFEVTLPV